jgi:hypothetical protein
MEDLKTRGNMPMDNITQLLGDGKLPPELVNTLQEAFDRRVTEAREQAEMAVREEFSRRYEHDKETLVEAIDRMLTDVVQRHENEKAVAVTRFVEARTAFRKAVKETRKSFKNKLTEQATASRTVVAKKLREEVIKLREAKKKLTQERLSYADKLSAVKESLATDHAKRLRKIDEFVVRQVEKELKEFLEDHRALVTTRAKLVSESRKRLRETQTRFVKQAALKVEKVINATLKREMTQLHEDLERNRQNMFGRRIFEAVAAEFMTSYLNEGTEIRKLQENLKAREASLKEAQTKLNEAVKEGQVASRKVRLAEDRVTRTKVLGELLNNLRGEKRKVMEGMLETVRTDALRESFNKLLPVVLDETARSKSGSPASGKAILNEKRADRTPTVVTGGQRTNRLAEAVEAEALDIDSDIAQVIRLAGIRK